MNDKLQQTTREALVSEFSGERPQVALASGIDIDLLTLGDEEPFYVELPVAEIDTVSQNKRYYGADVIREIERQILEKRPDALMGHLSDAERSTAHPLPAGVWVGAARNGKKLYGKAYIPPGPVREYFRRKKATGGKVATSLYGTADHIWDAERGAWSVLNFKLESIDFGHADRVGVQSLADVPRVTSELAGTGGEEVPDPQTVDRSAIIRELTADDAVILPQVVRQAVLNAAPEKAVVAEISKALEPVVAELNGNLAEAVSGVVKELVELRQQVIVQEIERLVNDKIHKDAQLTDGVKRDRLVVTELVSSQKPVSVKQVAELVDEVVGRDYVKDMIAATVKETMGPSQRRPGQKPDGEDEAKRTMLAPKPGGEA